MKIVQLVNGRDTGGGMTHILSLIKGFGTSIEIVLVAINDGPIAASAKALGVEVHCLEGHIPSQYKQFKQLMKQLGKVDLLHVHGSRANLLGGLYGKFNGFPVVSTVHSDYELDYDETLLRKLILKPLSMAALKLIPYQISISEGIKAILVSRGFKAERLFTVYNGIDFSSYTPTQSKDAFVKEHNLPIGEGTQVIGIVTRYHPVKGLEVFIEAANRICALNEKALFIIAGSGDLQVKAQYQQMIDVGSYKNRIVLLGFVRPISNMLQILDINVLTSHSENAPYALLEGGYFGIPAISSKVGGVSELIEDRKTGLLFEDRDVDRLCEHLLYLMKNKAEAQILGQALQEKIKSNYTHTQMAVTHRDIYTQIIGWWENER